LLFALLPGASAQDSESTFAGIFRGKLPNIYPHKFNGTYYWDTKDFRKGDILYNGRLYHDISMNVDAYEGDLQVRPLVNATPMVIFRDQVAWFTMGGLLFVNLQYLGWPEAPDGYFQVIRNGPCSAMCCSPRRSRNGRS